jgi:hypothetical protein
MRSYILTVEVSTTKTTIKAIMIIRNLLELTAL